METSFVVEAILIGLGVTTGFVALIGKVFVRKLQENQVWKIFAVGWALTAAGVGVFGGKVLFSAFSHSSESQLYEFSEVLANVKRICGRYPTSAEGLAALAGDPYKIDCESQGSDGIMKKIGKDSKGRAFVYISDGKSFTIRGPDNTEITVNEDGTRTGPWR